MLLFSIYSVQTKVQTAEFGSMYVPVDPLDNNFPPNGYAGCSSTSDASTVQAHAQEQLHDHSSLEHTHSSEPNNMFLNTQTASPPLLSAFPSCSQAFPMPLVSDTKVPSLLPKLFSDAPEQRALNLVIESIVSGCATNVHAAFLLVRRVPRPVPAPPFWHHTHDHK